MVVVYIYGKALYNEEAKKLLEVTTRTIHH